MSLIINFYFFNKKIIKYSLILNKNIKIFKKYNSPWKVYERADKDSSDEEDFN
jgi:hypothetical protein